MEFIKCLICGKLKKETLETYSDNLEIIDIEDYCNCDNQDEYIITKQQLD